MIRILLKEDSTIVAGATGPDTLVVVVGNPTVMVMVLVVRRRRLGLGFSLVVPCSDTTPTQETSQRAPDKLKCFFFSSAFFLVSQGSHKLSYAHS